jgi:endoglucanase
MIPSPMFRIVLRIIINVIYLFMNKEKNAITHLLHQMICIKNTFRCLMLLILSIIGFGSCSSDDNGGTNVDTSFSVTKTEMSFLKTGGTSDFYVKAQSKPTVVSDASWCTVASVASQSATTYHFQVTAPVYTENNDRTATITITEGSNTATLAVTQTSQEGLVITSDKNVSVSAQGGTITVKLSSNSDFTVVTSNDWIVDNDTRANMKDYTRTFTISSNVGAARTGTISFTHNGDASITESVTVSQAAGTGSGDMSHTAAQLAKLMYPGWNLGNTMEAGDAANIDKNVGVGTETAWQGTKTTQAIIDYIKAQGFKSVRIPCAWVMGHITDATNCTIDPQWMTRVQEVVDYCIKDGLYVIINDHYDGGWIEKSFTKVDATTVAANSAKLKKIWTQIANHFIGYDEHLLFAGLNEPAAETQAQTDALIKYEQAFIDAVRTTGGNNATRTLIVQGPSTNIDNTNKYFDISKLNDTASNRLMAEVHYYDPWYFCGLEKKDESSTYSIRAYWGSANHVSGSALNCDYGEESYMEAQLKKMKTQFVDKGIPVILGEYGVNWRGETGSASSINTETINAAKHDASVQLFYKLMNQYSIECGIVPFAWDTNYVSTPSMTIFNRSTLAIYDNYMMNGIKEGVSAASFPY